MADQVRWGIVGCGGIARKFAACLPAVDGAVLAAVGSRSQSKADAFALEVGAERAYGSYEALMADESVTAVYVSTPHPQHAEPVRQAIAAGKAVLCEKPFAINRATAAEAVALARQAGTFLMEAMWTRFLPASEQVRRWLADGCIGEVRLVTIDFGFKAEFDPKSRLFDPELGGGALLDVGVYTIAYANMAMGAVPDAAVGQATLGATGVDEAAGYVLRYPGGRLAVASCGATYQSPWTARLDGTLGRITVPQFWNGSRATLEVHGAEPETVELPHDLNGFEYEVREVGRCLAAGLTESPTMPLAETVATAGVMDDLRAQFGVRYPME